MLSYKLAIFLILMLKLAQCIHITALKSLYYLNLILLAQKYLLTLRLLNTTVCYKSLGLKISNHSATKWK